MTTLAADTRITPRVVLRRELGRGGMGSVWVARHDGLDADVAVKFIGERQLSRADAVERFRREASTAAKLKSPHVVTIFDHGVSDDGRPYIVMELLEGESLSERLRRKGALSAAQVGLLVAQVAKVLTEAHGLGIVHRDLKPANLFLVDSGYELFVKVLDFGIAKETRADVPSELTETGAVVGTPHFMSPEMLMSTKAVDHRADLWALAVVAYVALTGSPPFDGETLAALSVAIHEGRFEPPSSRVPGLSAAVDAWFKVALCRAPGARFEDAATMAHAWRDALRDAGAADVLPPSSAPDELARATTLARPAGQADQTETVNARPTDADEATTRDMAGAPPPDDDPGTTQDAPLATLPDDRSREASDDALSPVGPAADPARSGASPVNAAANTAATTAGTTVDTAMLRPRRSDRRRWVAAGIVVLAASGLVIAARDEPTRVPSSAAAPAPTATDDPPAIPRDRFAPSEPLSLPPAEVSAAPPPAPRRETGPRDGQAQGRPIVKPPAGDPTPASSATGPRSRPAYCEVNPFTVNAEGDFLPKPECFPVKQ